MDTNLHFKNQNKLKTSFFLKNPKTKMKNLIHILLVSSICCHCLYENLLVKNFISWLLSLEDVHEYCVFVRHKFAKIVSCRQIIQAHHEGDW